ncbi:MAG: PaaI family thioesterase [Rubrivivax sp.]
MHPHPFGDLIGLRFAAPPADGASCCELTLASEHLNPHGVAHGAVLFAMADTGMGAALYPSLAPGESCATIEIKINFHRSAPAGTLRCTSTVVNRGRSVATLESRLTLGDRLVATASGNFAIFPRERAAG